MTTNPRRKDAQIIDVVAPARPPLVTGRFLLVLVASLAYFTGLGILFPTLPLYVDGPLGGSTASIGVAVASFSIAALVLRPWAGTLAERRGRRFLMTTGAAIVAVSVAAYAVADSVGLLVALRLVTGAGEALFFVGAATLASDLAPESRRGEAMSLFTIAPYAGLIAGPLAGEAVYQSVGFDVVWVAAAACGALAVAVAAVISEGRPTSRRTDPPARGRLLHPAALAPGLVLFASISALSTFNAFAAPHARAIGLDGAGAAFALYGAIIIGVRLFGAKLPDRLGAGRAASAALVLTALGLAGIALVPTPTAFFAATAVLAAGQSLAFPALMALAIGRAPAGERGVAVATMLIFVDLGFAGGPLGGGLAGALLGERATFLTAALLAVCGLPVLARATGARAGSPLRVAAASAS
jgi:MFS family permease